MWTEGICGDSAAILKDGVMVPVDEVINALNQMMFHGEENHIIDCNYCGKQQIIVHPTSMPKHKVFCPICRTQMIPTRWQTDDGAFLFGWSCGCNEDSRWVKP